MFTTEQKKLIIELQTSKKYKGGLIGNNDSEENLHRCCLGVYAHCCGYKKTIENLFPKIKFEFSRDIAFFKDYSQWNLYSENGKFCDFYIYLRDGSVKISTLAALNDSNIKDFDHKFISKFLFTMPERVFRNFNEGHLSELDYEFGEFFLKVEKLAEEKNYIRITEGWKKELS